MNSVEPNFYIGIDPQEHSSSQTQTEATESGSSNPVRWTSKYGKRWVQCFSRYWAEKWPCNPPATEETEFSLS
jgi:hypothetical protein